MTSNHPVSMAPQNPEELVASAVDGASAINGDFGEDLASRQIPHQLHSGLQKAESSIEKAVQIHQHVNKSLELIKVKMDKLLKTPTTKQKKETQEDNVQRKDYYFCSWQLKVYCFFPLKHEV